MSSHTEAAVGALGSAYAAHELVKALDDDKHEAGDHYLKAAVGAAVAVGAFYQLSKKADHPLWRRDSDISSDDEDAQHTELVKTDQTQIVRHKHHEHHEHHEHHGSHGSHHLHPAHNRLLLEEAVGAYSLGKELLGDKRHHIIHLIGEALGAVGTIKDIHDQRS
ncbi:uncharacterized protein A1O9_09433 [Exophiala aquamarina CBS 119918]|uniref:Uncharacterized protein n=1 Tax=Exophiala aquamarina CBS 119918 TaxID=1182545 RepID=A0A072P3L9_9EURO|nr:uncharacterized protein A1O9_09433 [Exophiala aquamarina CBS 119918]KEF54267.1 hypothetical protein A1O9_09433 [Exophiala aquamarina CBS 119918]